MIIRCEYCDWYKSKMCNNSDSEKYKNITLAIESCTSFYPRLSAPMQVEKKKSESVNHPNHYNIGDIEVIDFIESWKLNFSLGNAIKYIARAPYKGKELEDLKKAMWYIKREIERLEKEGNK